MSHPLSSPFSNERRNASLPVNHPEMSAWLSSQPGYLSRTWIPARVSRRKARNAIVHQVGGSAGKNGYRGSEVRRPSWRYDWRSAREAAFYVLQMVNDVPSYYPIRKRGFFARHQV